MRGDHTSAKSSYLKVLAITQTLRNYSAIGAKDNKSSKIILRNQPAAHYNLGLIREASADLGRFIILRN